MAISTPNTTFEAASDPILEIRNASVTFDIEHGDSKVLNDVNISIEREEIFGIVGESGSGKSMFAAALVDAIPRPGILTGNVTYYPSDGKPFDVLSMDDEELRQFRWEEIAMVFQGAMSSFNPTSTIRRHFVETLKAHDADVESGLERAHQLLSDLYLNSNRVLDSYAHELSGGMQQRTLIALSMILRPNVLVMDEPTAALDLLMQRSILSLIKEIQQKYNITIVFITHDLPLVTRLADRLAVMYAFKFAEVGSTQQMVENPVHPYTRALLNSTPNLGAPIEEMKAIQGTSPSPTNLPRGCSYHPRCPLSSDICEEEFPEFHDVTDDHFAACYHWESAPAEIPIILNRGGDTK